MLSDHRCQERTNTGRLIKRIKGKEEALVPNTMYFKNLPQWFAPKDP